MVDVIGIYLALSSCDGRAKARPRGATPRPWSGAEARGPHARRAAAKRIYPKYEVRGSG